MSDLSLPQHLSPTKGLLQFTRSQSLATIAVCRIVFLSNRIQMYGYPDRQFNCQANLSDPRRLFFGFLTAIDHQNIYDAHVAFRYPTVSSPYLVRMC